MIEIQAPPIPGLYMGTSVSTDIIQAMNAELGSTGYFGSMQDPYRDHYQTFANQFVNPIRMAQRELKQTLGKELNMDAIYALTSREDLLNTPISMHMPILMHAPVKDLFERGLIDGYGYDPTHLPEEDVYGRLIDNGRVSTWYDGPKLPDTFRTIHRSDDPDLTPAELDHIEMTRNFIDTFLIETVFDPTSPDDVRG